LGLEKDDVITAVSARWTSLFGADRR